MIVRLVSLLVVTGVVWIALRPWLLHRCHDCGLPVWGAASGHSRLERRERVSLACWRTAESAALIEEPTNMHRIDSDYVGWWLTVMATLGAKNAQAGASLAWSDRGLPPAEPSPRKRRLGTFLITCPSPLPQYDPPHRPAGDAIGGADQFGPPGPAAAAVMAQAIDDTAQRHVATHVRLIDHALAATALAGDPQEPRQEGAERLVERLGTGGSGSPP
jgi:hypothetical protein